MKLTSSGRTWVAAMTRSPSFSRSSSSMITTMRPWRMSSRISSVVFKWSIRKFCQVTNHYAIYWRALTGLHPGRRASLTGRLATTGSARPQHALNVTRDDVHLEVQTRARAIAPKGRHGQRMRDEVHVEAVRLGTVDSEAHP